MKRYGNFEEREKMRQELDERMMLDEQGVGIEVRLYCIQTAIEDVCELLENLVECAKEGREAAKAKEDVAKFVPGKIGADIGEENVQEDVVARIFGNVRN